MHYLAQHLYIAFQSNFEGVSRYSFTICVPFLSSVMDSLAVKTNLNTTMSAKMLTRLSPFLKILLKLIENGIGRIYLSPRV